MVMNLPTRISLVLAGGWGDRLLGAVCDEVTGINWGVGGWGCV